MDTFRIFVYTIVALALMAVLLRMFAFFAPEQDVEKELSNMLSIAEANLGKYNASSIMLQQDKMLNAELFDTASRTVIFLCNNNSVCCQRAEACSKAIEWDNAMRRFVLSKQKKEVRVAARCRFEKLFICRLYFGQEPAQLTLEKVSIVPESKVLELGEKPAVEFTIANTGKIYAIATPKIRLYLRDSSAQEQWIFIDEFYGGDLGIGPGQSKSSRIELFINMAGHYKMDFVVFEKSDETDFVQESFEISIREKG